MLAEHRLTTLGWQSQCYPTFLVETLNHVAGKDREGKQKPWHFMKADRGARTSAVDRSSRPHREWKVSKVV